MAIEKSIEELVNGAYEALLAVDAFADAIRPFDGGGAFGEDRRVGQIAYALGKLVESGLAQADAANGRLRSLRLDSGAAAAAVVAVVPE
jgi:hypothetical protein